MNWLQLSIPAEPDTLEEISAKLTAMGFDSFQIEDERDFDAFVSTASPSWDYVDESVAEHYKGACRILLYLPERADCADSISALRAEFGGISETTLQQSDWENSWKQYYKPTPIGKRLLIQPAWEPLSNPENRAVFRNNPGMSFGTGLHATTALCLEMLEESVRDGMSLLDLGCGSGILSICGLLLGADNAVAVDIDPLAADIAKENAGLNDCAYRLTVCAGNVLEDDLNIGGGWDIICSNIVADVIIKLSPYVKERIAANGLWIVSGLIDTRFDEVRHALEGDGWKEKQSMTRDGWGAIQLQMTDSR